MTLLSISCIRIATYVLYHIIFIIIIIWFIVFDNKNETSVMKKNKPTPLLCTLVNGRDKIEIDEKVKKTN